MQGDEYYIYSYVSVHKREIYKCTQQQRTQRRLILRPEIVAKILHSTSTVKFHNGKQ